jgi:hypothetical protein
MQPSQGRKGLLGKLISAALQVFDAERVYSDLKCKEALMQAADFSVLKLSRYQFTDRSKLPEKQMLHRYVISLSSVRTSWFLV